MHRPVALAVLVSILIPTGRLYAIEFVEDLDDPSRAPGYAFEGYKFGDGNSPWTVQGLSAGGVNNTGCSQVTAANMWGTSEVSDPVWFIKV